MWKFIGKTKAIFRFSISLKNCAYTTPQQLEQLKNKFYSNPAYLSKLQYLHTLQKHEKLDSFYQDKPVDLLNQQEIYYLFNSDIDYKFNNKLRKQIMSKIQSTFFKCILAKQFSEIDEVQQYLIVLNFNEKVLEMTLQQILFCLQVISNFKVGQNEIDQTRIAKILLKLHQKQQKISQLLIMQGHLMDINLFFKDHINKDWQILRQKLNKQSKIQFNLIYYLITMQERQIITMTVEEKDIINYIMKNTLNSFKFNYIEQKHLAFILKYYESHIKYLNIENFTTSAYIAYLQFYQKNLPKIIPKHQIPHFVIQKTTINQFHQILELRIKLNLDDVLSLSKSLPTFFKHSMKAINAFFKLYRNYKRDQQKEIKAQKIERSERIQRMQKSQKLQKNSKISYNEISQEAQMKQDINEQAKTVQDKKSSQKNTDEEIKYYIQKVANEKLSARALLKDGILKEYDFNGIIHFLANLSKHECGSYIFWGRVLHWLQNRILKDYEQKTCQISQQNYVSLLYLALNKVFKQRVRQIVYQQIIKLLLNSNAQIQFSFLSNICKVLQGSKVGQNKIWLLIEQKVNSYFNQTKVSKNHTKDILKIANSFNSMNKGSAIFWSHLNSFLDNNSKRSLLKSKKIESLAQIHLSLKKATTKNKIN